LNDSSRRLNAPRSTTRRHRPGGTSRGSCWSWIPGAPAPKQLRWRMTVQPTDTTIGVEVTRCSRDQAQGGRRHHRGASGAGSAGGGSGAVHPARSTGARPPAGSCPTDTTQLTNRQTGQADRIQQPSPEPTAPKEVPVQTPRTSLAQEQTAARTAPTGWCCCRDAARVRRARTRNQGGRSLLLESM
jgi:hypothetical protein